MKILHINRNYVSSPLHQVMVQHLNKLELENYVFCPTESDDIALSINNANVYIKKCFNYLDRYVYWFKQWKIKKALEDTLDLKQFYCIHAYTLFTDGNCAMNLSKKYGIPYVVAIRNTDVNAFFKKMPLLRKRGIEIMKNASAVFFLSSTYKKQVFEKYVPPRYKTELLNKTYIIPNGIDEFWHNNRFISKNIDINVDRINNKELNLIYVGRIDKNKNIISTCKAVDVLIKNGWKVKFYVIGQIDDNIEFNKIKDCITYYPHKDKETLLHMYRKADIFIMPSHKETFGLVYAEAMSQGIPVLYTKNQGFDGQFEDGYVGYSVLDTDVNDIVDKIEKCVENYSDICLRCIQASSVFDWDELCGMYNKIYKQLL